MGLIIRRTPLDASHLHDPVKPHQSSDTDSQRGKEWLYMRLKKQQYIIFQYKFLPRDAL